MLDARDPDGAPDRAGVLIIRAWLEDGAAFRARVTRVHDLRSGTQRTTVHASASEPRDIVDEWLASFTTSEDPG